jgi:hypothetical protein
MEGSPRIFSTANPEWFMVPSGKSMKITIFNK